MNSYCQFLLSTCGISLPVPYTELNLQMRSHFSTLFLSLEVQTDLTPTTTSTLFFRAICAANQCGPSVYALGLDKSTAFDSNLKYFLMEIHI